MKYLRRGLAIATGAYWAVLFTLTHVPKLPPPPGGMSDKGAHFLAYGGLAGALFLTLWAYRPTWGWLGWRVLAICAAYGAVDEWTQAIPFIHRSCDIRDWLADMGGTLVAITVLSVVRWAARRAVARRPVEAKMAA